MERTTISLLWGEERREVAVPTGQLAWVLSPADRAPLPDLQEGLRGALAQPIGSAPLAQLIRGKTDDVLVLVDDGTRPTPQQLLLPAVLDELNRAGVPDAHITLLVALGTHRQMSADELRKRFGAAVVARVRVENLDNHNPAAFIDMGTTASGIPVQVAQRYAQATFRLSVGNIVPHMYCGWSGGGKIVQPGVCSAVTTGYTHVMAGPHVREALGDINNPIRREMDEIARQTGLAFIINTVLNQHGAVTALVAGDPVAAHRRGVDLAREVYGVRVPELVDIVVASSHPADRDFWQAAKAFNAAGLTVKRGGTLILLNPAPEGVAPDHPMMVRLGHTPSEEVLRGVKDGSIPDSVGAATYLAMAVTRAHARPIIVSDPVGRDDFEAIGLSWRPDGQTALEEALQRHGPGARIGVLTHAADTLPLLG